MTGTARRARRTDLPSTALLLQGTVLGLALALYNLALIERKYSFVLNKAPFLLMVRLNAAESAIYVVTLMAEVVALVVTATCVIHAAWRILLRRDGPMKLAPAAAAGGFLVMVSVQFKVLRYFKDGLDFAVAKKLAGGSFVSAVRYVQDEFAGLLPSIGAAAVLAVLAAYLLLRLGDVLEKRETRLADRRVRVTWKRLAACNVLLCALPLAIHAYSPALTRVLKFALAHGIYSLPASYLTDFDFDGYGMLSEPPDFAPFDPARHPYAVEIVGNGIDEDGVAGDLVAVTPPRPRPDWAGAELDHRNVVLVVLESARRDLLDARVGEEWVMPNLHEMPGQTFNVVSHAAFSSDAVCSILNGSVVIEEGGRSLIDLFKSLGYATAAISGQHEGLGRIAQRTNMAHADLFADARSFPQDERMYSGTTEAGLAVPSHVVNRRFDEWLERQDQSRPFFAYLNYQEMHFPYYHEGMARTLVETPIPRSKIDQTSTKWLRETYLNAARATDEALGGLRRILENRGVWGSTVVLVLGDHGEELFDRGYLGHGVRLNTVQLVTLGKLIHGGVEFPGSYLAQSDVPTVLYDVLLKDPGNALPIETSILCFVGSVRVTPEVGLIENGTLTRYDFRRDQWTEDAVGSEAEVPASLDERVIHRWESEVLHFVEARNSTARK